MHRFVSCDFAFPQVPITAPRSPWMDHDRDSGWCAFMGCSKWNAEYIVSFCRPRAVVLFSLDRPRVRKLRDCPYAVYSFCVQWRFSNHFSTCLTCVFTQCMFVWTVSRIFLLDSSWDIAWCFWMKSLTWQKIWKRSVVAPTYQTRKVICVCFFFFWFGVHAPWLVNQKTRYFLNQSKVKLILILTCTYAFSRPWRR